MANGGMKPNSDTSLANPEQERILNKCRLRRQHTYTHP